MPVIIPKLTTGFIAGRREHQGRWHVYVKFEGGNGYGIPWQLADELAAQLLQEIESPIVQDVVEFPMRDRVYLLPNLPTADEERPLSWQLWRALLAKARECEEQEKAPQIAKDAAILHRSGAPFGLSNDPKIRAEAAHLAQHDERLRRVMPGNIKSAEALGAPTIEVQPPRPKDN